MPDRHPFAVRVLAIAQSIRPILHGHAPMVQGAVLAELLSLWLAGHAPEEREELLQFHIAQVREMTETNARLLRGEGTVKH